LEESDPDNFKQRLREYFSHSSLIIINWISNDFWRNWRYSKKYILLTFRRWNLEPKRTNFEGPHAPGSHRVV